MYKGLEPTRTPEECLRALAEAVPRATRPTDGAVGVPMRLANVVIEDSNLW